MISTPVYHGRASIAPACKGQNEFHQCYVGRRHAAGRRQMRAYIFSPLGGRRGRVIGISFVADCRHLPRCIVRAGKVGLSKRRRRYSSMSRCKASFDSLSLATHARDYRRVTYAGMRHESVSGIFRRAERFIFLADISSFTFDARRDTAFAPQQATLLQG